MPISLKAWSYGHQMRQEFRHNAWSDATVKQVETERCGYERARARLPELRPRAHRAIAASSVMVVLAIAAAAWVGWVWLAPVLILTVVSQGVMLVDLTRAVSRAIPMQTNGDLRELTTDELEALHVMTSEEPALAQVVSRWVNAGMKLRQRDLQACEGYFADTAPEREERAIRARLTAPDRLG